MVTAFQIGGFQFSGFQEGLRIGGGDIPAWMRRAMLLRRRKAKPAPVEPEEEEAEPVPAMASLRLRPNSTVAGNARLLLAARAREAQARDEADFRAFVEQVLASEDFFDA